MERRLTIANKTLFPKLTVSRLKTIIRRTLDANKAQDIVSIDLTGKADFADNMIIASGTSQRHVGALAEHVVEELKSVGLTPIPVEGDDGCDWVLVDAGDIVVHLFKPETRSHYNLEKMWSVQVPEFEAAH